MTFQRSILTMAAVALLGLAQLGYAADARAADDPTYPPIDPSVTDAAIVDTTPTRGKNLVWLAPEARRVGKLLVFLPTGGLNNVPSEFSEFGTQGARLGYHTIILAYRNEAPVAAPPPGGCGSSPEPPASPPNCAITIRMELLDGRDESTVVDVDRANSIENRLDKLLEYLVATHPDDGWAKFLDTSGAEPQPKWSETVIAGSSLGAGQAAIIAAQHSVHRASLLHGWTDAKHGWVTLGATPSNRYFTLIHARDNFFARTCYAYVALGLAESCPLPGFTVPPATVDPTNPLLVENRPPPFGTPQLVFNLEPGSFAGMGDHYHQSTSRNGWIAREADGTPSQKLLNAWRSVLGDSDADTWLDRVDNCPLVANPEQTANGEQIDTDDDGIGDACDPTPQGTIPPVIVVPGHITVDATGPAGATVTYTVTATDDIDPDPTVLCTPSTGSLFAIGDTPVECSSTDAAGNTASASFLVTVLGAKQQLASLIRKIIDATSLPAAVKTRLIATLQSLAAGFDPNKPLQRKAACLTLKVFTSVVRLVAPPAQAAEWTSDANRIRAVLAC